MEHLQLSPPETCRVALLNTPSKTPTGQIQTGYSSLQSRGGIRYNEYGAVLSDFSAGLRVPQMRPFLGPDVFNGGCAPMYCKDEAQCPQSVRNVSSPQTRAMLDAAFASTCPFTGNDAAPACFQGKCSGYNSTIGWEATPQGTLRWQMGAASSSATC